MMMVLLIILISGSGVILSVHEYFTSSCYIVLRTYSIRSILSRSTIILHLQPQPILWEGGEDPDPNFAFVHNYRLANQPSQKSVE